MELNDWLEIATRRLCSEARERIRTEIEDHYLDSVEANRLQGMGESEARYLAIISLGNPKSAARSFRRNYLTNFQNKLMKNLECGPHWFELLLRSVLLVITLAINASRIEGTFELIFLLSQLLLMLTSVAGYFWVAPLLYRCQWIRLGLGMNLLSTWMFFASIQIGTDLIWGSPSLQKSAALYSVILAVITVILATIFRKLRDQPSKAA